MYTDYRPKLVVVSSLSLLCGCNLCSLLMSSASRKKIQYSRQIGICECCLLYVLQWLQRLLGSFGCVDLPAVKALTSHQFHLSIVVPVGSRLSHSHCGLLFCYGDRQRTRPHLWYQYPTVLSVLSAAYNAIRMMHCLRCFRRRAILTTQYNGNGQTSWVRCHIQVWAIPL